MLSIKTVCKGGLNHVLSLVKNNFDGCGWYELKELTNKDILFLKAQGFSPYIETKNIPQDTLNQLI